MRRKSTTSEIEVVYVCRGGKCSYGRDDQTDCVDQQDDDVDGPHSTVLNFTPRVFIKPNMH